MAKKRTKTTRKDAVTLTKNGFILLTLFVVAITTLVVYVYMGYVGVR